MGYIVDFGHDGYVPKPLNYVLRLRGTSSGVVDKSGCNTIQQYNMDTSQSSTLGEGRQLKFNGTNAYMQLTHTKNKIDTNEDFTCSVWVMDEDMSRAKQCNAIIIYIGDSGYAETYPTFNINSTNFIVDSTKYRINIFYHWNFGSVDMFSQSTPYTTPYHLAVVRKDGITRCAMNGVFSDQTLSVTTDFLRLNTKVNIGLTSRSSANYTYAKFTLDDLCLIKGRAIWTENFTPPTNYLPDKW